MILIITFAPIFARVIAVTSMCCVPKQFQRLAIIFLFAGLMCISVQGTIIAKMIAILLNLSWILTILVLIVIGIVVAISPLMTTSLYQARDICWPNVDIGHFGWYSD